MKTCAKIILKKWLAERGYDGLANPEIPCGCLLEDLAPCEEMGGGLDCFAGRRVNFMPNEKCGCEGEGTMHYHVVVEGEDGLASGGSPV